MYEAASFTVVEGWEDKEWLAGIEKGALWPPEKLLMVCYM